MPEFKLYSSLTGAEMVVSYDGKSETIHISRPFWEDVLLVNWLGERYKIKKYLSNPKVRIFGKELIAVIREDISRSDVIVKSDIVFTFKRIGINTYEILRKDRLVGRFNSGFPVLSWYIGRSNGEWKKVPAGLEKLLILALIGFCV